MIVGLTIRNFKGIREIVDLPLHRFHVLVGPNGSGKTSFLDAVDFVRDCLYGGPAFALLRRNISDFDDITWMRHGGPVIIEFWLDFEESHPDLSEKLFHYRLTIEKDDRLGVQVKDELLEQYPRAALRIGDELRLVAKAKSRRLLGKTTEGRDFYSREKGTYQDVFTFGPDRLTLGQTPPDEERYPAANAVRGFLTQGVRLIQLDSPAMRLPCPAVRSTELELDGTNLARVVGRLIGPSSGLGPVWPDAANPVSLWAQHLRYALPDLAAIGWARRQADNAEYLVLRHDNGLEAPSWLLSDGTLRMMALTIPAFLLPEPALYMVEEPENGVHPKALEIILQSLQYIPRAQMLITTHSPYVVAQCGVEPLLCFTRENGETRITPGLRHPHLQDWDGTPDLGLVFATGILE